MKTEKTGVSLSFEQANDGKDRLRLGARIQQQARDQEQLQEILRYVELESTPPFQGKAGSLEAIRSILDQNLGGSLITAITATYWQH